MNMRGNTMKPADRFLRTIPMNDVVVGMLLRNAKKSITDFVFSRKNRRIGESYLTHQFKKAVRRLLGHSSSRTTEVCSHLQCEHLHGTVNRIAMSTNLPNVGVLTD